MAHDDGVDLTNLEVPATEVEERVKGDSEPESAATASSGAMAADPVQTRNTGLRQLAVWLQRAAWVVFGLVNVGTVSGLILLLGQRQPYFNAVLFWQFLSVMGSFVTSVVVWMLMMAVGGMIPVFLDIEEHAREISDRGA